MNDGGSEHPRSGVGSDPKMLVATATTVAAILLAGSAYVWRRGSGVMNLAHAASDGTTSQTDTPHGRDVSDTTKARLRRDATGKGKANTTGRRASVSAQGAKPLSDDGHATDDGDDPQGGSARQREAAASLGKSSRAKERRRRGKDPMKELMKPGGGKLAKILKETDASTASGSQPSRARTTSTSEAQRHASTSRQQEKSPSDDSSTTQKAGSSSSSTIFPSSSTVSEPNQDQPRASSLSSSSARSRSRSRSLSRTRNDVAHAVDHEPSTSKTTNRNSDAASTISSASSSTATDASTLSTSSTAPTSLSSSVSGLRVDADATPKAESTRTGLGALPRSPISQGKKPQQQEAPDPWDWDGAGSFSSPTKPLQSRKSQPKLRTAPNPASSTAGGSPIAYASVVSAKSPKEEDSRSTVGRRTGAKQHMQPSLSSTDDNAETVEAEGEEEEEVPPLVFPSLNNPAPSDTASSVPASTQSSFSVGSATASSSSLSRPHSRASNSSSAHPAQIGGLKSKSPVPRSGGSATMAPLSGTGAETPSVGSRRAPTPLGSAKRPATPGSAASSPLLSGSIVPPSPSSQSFGQAGNSSVLSAQTQVASLRGALEASRLREVKQKEEMEKMTKEKEMMQWENAAWRRREVELQTQIQQMMHQLQSYNAYFSSLNHGHHPPQVISPPQSTAPTPHTPGAQLISARDNDSVDHDDGTPPANAGDPLQIVSPTSAEKDGNDTPGGNNAEKNGDGGGVGERSAVGQGPSVPGPDSAAASPAKGAVEPEEGSSSSTQEVTDAPLKVSTSSLVHPTPIAPTAYNPALSPPVMSPSILHSPMGSFPHYALHATPPVGFGPHGLPSPMSYPFHMPPHPLQPPHVQQHHPYMVPSSAPQSPGIGMMPPPSLAHMNPNPFVVSPAAATFGRPGTPGSLGAMAMLNGHPHPHTPAGMGMGLGNSMSSPFSVAGVGSGTASPDPTGSPSSTTAFLMQDRGRRRMSGGSASGSVLGRSLRGRSSVTLLPLDSGIGGSQGLKRGGKSSSGSSVSGEGEGEEHAIGEEEGDFNQVLASAILKRPETVRMGSSRKESFKGGDGAVSPASPGLGLPAGSVSLNGIWSGYGQGAVGRTESPGPLPEQQSEHGEGDEEERPQEFVFPSLNDVGPVAHLSSSRPGSTSSSVSHSPEAKSPQLRSSTPALGTLMEEVGEGAMVKSESVPAPLHQPAEYAEFVENSSTSH